MTAQRLVDNCSTTTAQPCTHIPFLFAQNHFPLTSYPSIGINMSFSFSPLSYADAISFPLGSPSMHARPLIPLFSKLDTPKCCLQHQRIVRDRSLAEKMEEAPPSPHKKKCRVAAQNSMAGQRSLTSFSGASCCCRPLHPSPRKRQ